LFTYDGSGKLIRALYLEFNTGTNAYDSSYRDIYIYDASGYVARDSAESYMGGAWTPEGTTVYTNNSSGYPTLITGVFYFGPVPMTFYEVSVTYTAANYTRLIIQVNQGIGLENYEKDTLGYFGNALNYHDVYTWDTAANNWALYSQERRHLNTASKPDSVFTRTVDGVGGWDTGYQKLGYNANGNPMYVRSYVPLVSLPATEYKYYYGPLASGAVANVAPLSDITVYPNPATGSIRLQGSKLATTGSWHYQISNISGQVLESGSIPSSAAIPVNALPAGIYSISVQDARNANHVARFQKL
jgi:hypothetical protein